MPLVEAIQITKVRSPSFALGPITVRISRGEALSVVGPAGAGKTTLLRLLWGFLRPDAGTIRVLGLEPHLEQIRMRRRAGFVGDTSRLCDWMSAGQYLAFTSGFYPTFERRHAETLLGQLGLDSRSKVGHLSRGGRVKLALAAALAHQPDLLILDDPVSDLDRPVRDEVLGLLKDMSGRGVGIIVASRRHEDLDGLASAALILDDGKAAPSPSDTGACRRLPDIRRQTRSMSPRLSSRLEGGSTTS